MVRSTGLVRKRSPDHCRAQGALRATRFAFAGSASEARTARPFLGECWAKANRPVDLGHLLKPVGSEGEPVPGRSVALCRKAERVKVIGDGEHTRR